MAEKKSYKDQAVGMDVVKYPSLIDDCLTRATITSQLLAGSGDKDTAVAEGNFGAPFFVGFQSLTIPKAVNEAGEVKADISYNALTRTIEVRATAGVVWKAVALFQRNTKD